MRTLLRGGVIRAGSQDVSAMATEDGRIAWLGDTSEAGSYDGADETIDLRGRFVAPAFVDAHVHTVQTGRQLDGLGLLGTLSRHDVLDRLANYLAAAPADEVVIGSGWDETDWADRELPTADEIERVAPGRSVYLSRVDGHSAIASHGMLAQTPGIEALEGWSESGRLERDAKRLASDRLGNLDGPTQRLKAARTAVSAMAAVGIGAFHENAAPHIGPEWELALVRQAADEAGLGLTAYWGELGAYDKVASLGVAGLAGDLNADGAVGSRTAAVRDPYTDLHEHCGHGYLDPAQIADHVVGCTRRSIQAGFHCIGDAALDAIAEGFAAAAMQVGDEALRAAGHRLEHCEMPSATAIELFARLGVIASVQPQFDALWGGPSGMYAERLGSRWSQLNPFADLAAAGIQLALGSDAPVTTPVPWAAVQAAVHHRTEGQGLTVYAALEAHTRGGRLAARQLDEGFLGLGAPATYAVWSSEGFPDLTIGAELPRCLRTVVDGRTVYRSEDH